MINDVDRKFLRMTYDEAKAGYDERGCPIWSAAVFMDTGSR